MGNCLFGGMGDVNEVIKVLTSNGGIMEFNGPITAECITDEFPGQGIFRSHDLFWKPLPHHEVLRAGESYYLLPLNTKNVGGQIVQVGHVRSNSVPASVVLAPYRMSFDGQGMLKRSYTEAFSRYDTGGGVWKVKLVISRGQLLEILSQEARTQELIESVRTVAKCGTIGVSSVGFSDQWSLSSSRNASFKKDGLLEM
ncbi:Receptor-type tyrosine-protein like [Actinidia chinensis var. chinensis]|uniref:Receptor-type tyrosine-protein like n=1 Tax=Actinidia chinensis var. chinensis TaxID=1590841 RepID=A0A2R6QMY7_ACTCC|nr:Receptor-type tyrosine-protein like [Actinidia chinensis var. chinensis]